MNSAVTDSHAGATTAEQSPLRPWLRKGADAGASIWAAWSSITRRELTTTVSIGAGMAFIFTMTSLEALVGTDAMPLARALLMFGLWPFLDTFVALLCWVVADRSPAADGWPRSRRLAASLVVVALFCAWLTPFVLYNVIGLESPLEKYAEKCKSEHCGASIFLVNMRDTLGIFVFGGLIFSLIDVRRRRNRHNAALAAANRERVVLTRRVFESKLAAMQAQVEPQFLFDSLLDIEALYEVDPDLASTILDDLILYLRVALPRLRQPGSRVDTEIDLVRAYLAVVSARHGGRPVLDIRAAPECGRALFYPMLLLPLVQRAVRGAGGAGESLPARIDLTVDRVHREGHAGNDDGIVLRLRIAAAGLCRDDPELARVRERLAGLYADGGSLHCDDHAGGQTEFRLQIPYRAAA